MHITPLTFDERRDVRVFRTRNEITLPVSRDGTIVDARRSLGDRDRINNATAGILGVTRALLRCICRRVRRCVVSSRFKSPRACTNKLRWIVSCDTRISIVLGYSLASHPLICAGDELARSFSFTTVRSSGHCTRCASFGRFARRHARTSASSARYVAGPPLRAISRLAVEGARRSARAISRIDEPAESPREMDSRSV